MKPLTLTMQAFGPFAGTECINFAELGPAPLFLINGPTGSGKTTILDAICYALYGTTTGAEREGAQMRCQYSPAELFTQVQLKFALGGHRYQITRSPDQLRPKQRGEGMTEQKSRAELYRLGEDGRTESGRLLVEHKLLDANRCIRDIIGMNADQFRQVMVLPQGQFRKLLMADSQEREDIFQSLFQTGVYKTIEERLKQSASTIRRDFEAGHAMLRGILETGEVSDESSLLAELEKSSALVKDSEEHYQIAYAQWQQADRKLTETQHLQATLGRLNIARQEREALVAQEPRIQQSRCALKLAKAAAQLIPAMQRLKESEQSLEGARSTLKSATAELVAADDQLATARSALTAEQERSPARESLRQQSSQLQAYLPRVASLRTARTAVADREAALNRIQDDQQLAALSLARLRDRGELLAADIERLRAGLGDQSGLEVQLLHIEQALARERQLAQLHTAQKQLEQQLAKLDLQRSKLRTAVAREADTLRQLRRAWHLGQARLLASALEEGEPCPVCGSATHPLPANRDTLAANHPDSVQTIPDEQGIEAQEQIGRDADQHLLHCEREIARLQSQLDSHRAQARNLADTADKFAGTPVTALEAELTRCQNARAQREADGALLIASENQQKTLLAELNSAETSVRERTLRAAQAKEELTLEQSRLSHIEAELPAAYREQAALLEAIAGIQVALTALDSARHKAETEFARADRRQVVAQTAQTGAEQEVEQQTQKCRERNADYQDALATSPFETDGERSAAAMGEPEMNGLEQNLADYVSALTEVKATVLALEQETRGRTVLDLAAVEAAEASARDRREESQQQLQRHKQRLSALDNIRLKLAAQRESNRDLEARYKVVGTLADVACGNTGAKISLQRYVLGVLLDDVLVQASMRLAKMSAGRYQLIRKLDPNKGRRAAGLDLEVHDDYTGCARPVATLSGGESFMAALSLALGLSDVVQSQTGGIALDTLFVDEGFGSLDTEALELAINTLMELQKAGRMVGIISHVTELREQMDVRIDLRGGRQGSHLNLVSPLAP